MTQPESRRRSNRHLKTGTDASPLTVLGPRRHPLQYRIETALSSEEVQARAPGPPHVTSRHVDPEPFLPARCPRPTDDRPPILASPQPSCTQRQGPGSSPARCRPQASPCASALSLELEAPADRCTPAGRLGAGGRRTGGLARRQRAWPSLCRWGRLRSAACSSSGEAGCLTPRPDRARTGQQTPSANRNAGAGA